MEHGLPVLHSVEMPEAFDLIKRGISEVLSPFGGGRQHRQGPCSFNGT